MEDPSRTSKPRRSRAQFIAIVAAVLVAMAALAWYWKSGNASAPAARTQNATAVRTATVERRDVPRYLSAVGTVQAFNTVAIRTRVDGEIRRVGFREGQEVRQGDLLVELDARPLEAQWRTAKAQVERDRAQLDNAKRDLERYAFLAESGSGPQQTLDTTRALVRQLEAAVEADVAQADAAHLQVQYATIRAPIPGRTGARLVDVGNMVHPGDASALVVITQIRPVGVTFAVPQDALPALREAMSRAKLPVTALSQDGSRTLDEGTLTLVDNQVDTTTGTVRCKALFPNAAEVLWPGEFVTARAQLGVFKAALVVPMAAVQNGPNGAFVYVVSNGIAKTRPVSVDATLARDAVLDKGVAEGEQVVTEGQFQIESGARVTIRP